MKTQRFTVTDGNEKHSFDDDVEARECFFTLVNEIEKWSSNDKKDMSAYLYDGEQIIDEKHW